MNYTTGPWYSTAEDVIHSEGGDAYDVDVIESKDEEPIAYVVVWGAVGHGNTRLISAAPQGYALAEHILAMANDPYLQGHPEWNVIVDEARAFFATVRGE